MEPKQYEANREAVVRHMMDVWEAAGRKLMDRLAAERLKKAYVPTYTKSN